MPSNARWTQRIPPAGPEGPGYAFFDELAEDDPLASFLLWPGGWVPSTYPLPYPLALPLPVPLP